MSEVPAGIRQLKDIKYLTIHHSGVLPGASDMTMLKKRATIYDRGHKNIAFTNSWPSRTDGKYGYKWISYHYLVDKKGGVLQTQDIKFARIHASDSGRGSKSHNRWGIAICIDGSYSSESISGKQLQAVSRLIVSIEKNAIRHEFSAISGHRETALSPTGCPGNNLHAKLPEIKRQVDKFRKDKNMPDLSEYEKRIATLQKEKKSLQNKVTSLEATVKKKDVETRELKVQMKRVNDELLKLRNQPTGPTEVKKLKRELTATKDEVRELKREISKLRRGKSSTTRSSAWDKFKRFLSTDV